jgi:hypothetical protein
MQPQEPETPRSLLRAIQGRVQSRVHVGPTMAARPLGWLPVDGAELAEFPALQSCFGFV